MLQKVLSFPTQLAKSWGEVKKLQIPPPQEEGGGQELNENVNELTNIGIHCFSGEKYHIQLIDEPLPPRTVPVHILPLYKEELDKMIADDVITAVHEPTDWVNPIVCNIKETPEGNKKIRLCLDPKDLNKNIG